MISCVCPTRQSRRGFLDTAINCFLGQTFTDSELIILDEGHTPHPELSLLECVAPRVKYFFLKDEGIAMKLGDKRNRINALARGYIIAHWDDDDMCGPERLSRQLAFMEETGKACVGYHDLLYFRCADRTLWKYYYQGKPCMYATGTSQFYLKSAWEANPFKPKIVGEDSQFSFDMAAKGQLASEDGAKQIVALAHSGNTYVPNFGQAPFLPASREEFPELFLKEHNL